MNLLEKINKCQSIIKLHHLQQRGWKSTPKSQNCVLLSCRLNFCANCLMGRAQFLNGSRTFGGIFEALIGVQMRQKWDFWKFLDVYFPTQVEFLNLVVICPSKIAISQDCFLCVKNVAESHFLLVFWLSGGPKLDEISWQWLSKCNFPWQIQKCWFFPKWSCQTKGSRAARDPLVEKTCFLPEKSQMTQNAKKKLKFVLELSYLVPCSFKEASAKMWRGSGIFLHFCALANRLWSTFILALHTCIRAQ